MTIGYSDIFANPHQCQCNRSSLYFLLVTLGSFHSQVTSSAVLAANTRNRVLPVPWSMAPTSGPRSFMPPLTEAASEDGDPSRPLGDVTLMAIKDQRAFSFDVDACNMWFKFLLFKYSSALY